MKGRYHTAPVAPSPRGASSRLRLWPRLAGLARGRPDVQIPVEGVAVDPLQLFGVELQIAQRAEAVLDLLPAARTDQCAGDDRVAQYPRDRHLRQALAALAG